LVQEPNLRGLSGAQLRAARVRAKLFTLDDLSVTLNMVSDTLDHVVAGGPLLSLARHPQRRAAERSERRHH
jgi:hypothetical protein